MQKVENIDETPAFAKRSRLKIGRDNERYPFSLHKW